MLSYTTLHVIFVKATVPPLRRRQRGQNPFQRLSDWSRANGSRSVRQRRVRKEEKKQGPGEADTQIAGKLKKAKKELFIREMFFFKKTSQ